MKQKVERGCHGWVRLVREKGLEGKRKSQQSQDCTRDEQPNPALTVMEQLNSASWNGMAKICLDVQKWLLPSRVSFQLRAGAGVAELLSFDGMWG